MDMALATAPSEAPSLPTSQLTPSRKRNHEGQVVDYSSFDSAAQQQSSPLTTPQSPAVSQDLGDQSSPLTDLDATTLLSPEKQLPEMAPSKAKMTFAEKQVDKAVKQAEKKEKEREKAEAKAKKEAEKKRKEDEREEARKARDEKKREKDAEKQIKEAEKQRKEAEALKKERAQMRIGAFFGKPSAASTPPTFSECGDVSRGSTPSRRNSIVSIDMEPPLFDVGPSPSKLRPDEKTFIMPFFVKENTHLAPFNRFFSSRASRSDDLVLNQDALQEEIGARFHKRRRLCRVKPVKQIMSEMNASASKSVDLTDSTDPLSNIPYKYLFYREDVRPAYQGTYTRFVSPRKARKLALNSSFRGLPETDYDYDSEAEWAEPEDGDEDVLDEDEKSEDEDADEEMDDFLDDEGDVAKRQLVVGHMEPNCSGLCWDGQSGQGPTGFDMSTYGMDVLHDSTTFPIDPYSTTHWSDLGKKSPKKRVERDQQSTTMQPPRLPLMTVDPNCGNLTPPLTLQNSPPCLSLSENNPSAKKGKASGPGKVVKFIPQELLPAFRTAIAGSSLTKVGLLEVLKTEFPKCTKDAIKHTVEAIAERRGKQWALKEVSG